MEKTYISPRTDIFCTTGSTVLSGSIKVTVDDDELTNGGEGSLDNAQSRRSNTVWDDEDEDEDL